VTRTFRQQLTSRPVRVALLTGVLAVILLFVVDRAPKGIEASGTIDQGHWGWPIVHLDSDDWVRALPPHIRKYPPGSLPVAAWPAGMFYDGGRG
jgi:hypothetical protein